MNAKCRLTLTGLSMWCAMIVMVLSSSVLAQADTTTPTIEGCEAKIAELQSALGLDEAAKGAAIGIYRGAVDQLARAAGYTQNTVEYQRLASEAPQLLSSIRAELALTPVDPAVIVSEGTTLAQLEQTLTQATVALQAARQNLTDLQAESTRRNEQRTALTERLVRVRQELVDLVSPKSTDVQPNTPPEIMVAQETGYRATVLVYQTEITSIEAELASYDARRELLPARRDRAQRRVSEVEKLVAAWQGVVVTQRQVGAEQAAQEALRLRREAARQHPVLKAFAEETVVIAKARVESQSTNSDMESSAQRLVRARTELSVLNSKFASIQNRLSASGLNRATGLLLRHQYEGLPDITSIRSELRSAQVALEGFDYQLIELQEERVEFGDIDRVAQVLLALIPQNELSTNQDELLPVARELASARRDLIDQLLGDASKGFDTLVELNTTLQETVITAEAYKGYIEERILWVRSIAGDRMPRLNDLRNDAAWLLDSKAWNRARETTTTFVQSRLLDVGVGFGFLLVLYLVSFRCRYWLGILGERVARYTTDSFRYTLTALLLTAIMSAPVAGTMFALGWLLKAPQDQVLVAVAMGNGLQAAAIFMYPLVFLRHMLRVRGLGLGHFRWSKVAAQPMRKNLRWFTPTIVPVILLVAVIDFGGDEASNASLGRILFSIELLILAVFLHRILCPTGPVLRRFMEANSGGWIHRLRHVWYLLAIMLPLIFAVLSWLGFHYTALQLQSRLEQSLILALVLVVANEILHRWLYVARRRVAVEGARRRRAQAELEAEALPDSVDAPTPLPAVVDEEKVDLPALSEQTTQIFKSAVTIATVIGLYIIWAQALPALRMLDRVQVWPTIQVVETIESTSDGQSALPVSSVPMNQGDSGSTSTLPFPGSGLSQVDTSASVAEQSESVSVTIADIGLSLIILMATWIAFRNVPGLIEIVVLQRLPLDAGSRYALSTVMRYLIAIVGIVVAFQTVGISWSNVQWLAAALTFGLAFGLQEIFANFVSGLIILAERPIRLGDTVTVGGVTGTVMRIRMRATTIADWDRKELIIPNKTFITADVINWTLSDSILRVKIPVGVSYSSDVDKVESLLRKVAKKNKVVLEDPEPQVMFKKFGDSSLEFEMRVYIPNIDYFVPIQHDLHNAIYKSFKQAGIEIAFPQRDLHLRSIGDLGKLIDRGNDSQPVQ